MAILTTTNQGLNFIGGTTFIQTGTTTVMSIQTDGNVGIGVISPGSKLVVNGNGVFGTGGTSTVDGILSIDGGSGTGGEAYLRLMRGGTSGFILNHTATGIQVRATANIPMFFYTNDTITLKINANNTISLPTYAAGYLKTDASGNVTADNTGGGLPGGPYLPLVGGTMASDASINMNSGQLTSVDFVDFGIGQLNGESSSNLILKSLGDITYNVDSNNNGNSSHIFQESGSELMRVRYDGNVGIGDTGPNTTLQVSTDSLTNNVAVQIGDGWVGNDLYHKEGGFLLISGTSQTGTQTGAGIAFQTRNNQNTNYWKSSMIMDRDGAIRFTLGGAGTVAGSEDFTILGNGNVGIGTTAPLGKLQINEYTVASEGNQGIHGELSVFANDGDESLFLGLKNSSYPNRGWAFNPVAFGINSSLQIKEHGSTSVRMTIKSGGNVGIGTTSPSFKLHVDSDVASGDVCFIHHDNPSQSSGTVMKIRSDAGDNAGSALLNIENNTGNALYVRGDRNVGIGTTGPGEKLDIVGNSITRSKTRGLGTNYATSEGWVKGAADTFGSRVGFFGGNFNVVGGNVENKVEYDVGPFGSQELVWMTVPETLSNADGGWNKDLNGLNNAADDGLMSIVYMRRDSGTPAGDFYHGCSGSATNNLDGTANTNPYFCGFTIASALPADVWCVSIGIIYAANDTKTTGSAICGSYRLDTGEKIHTGTTFRQKPSTTTQTQRVYHFYSTSPTAQLDFARPGWYLVDGSEPTLSDITAGAAGGSDVFWSAAGNDIHNDNSGNVGIGTITPGQKLSVQGDSTAAAGRFTAGGNTNTLELFGNSTTGQSSGLLVNAGTNTADYAARFRNAAGSVIMNIRGDGNVGIGTTSPDAKLQVNAATSGDVYLSGGSADLRYLNFSSYNTASDHAGHKIDATSSNGELAFAIGGSAKVYIKSSGNVGIGTSSPDAQLEISNPNTTSGAGGATLRLTRADITSVAGDPVGTIEFYSTDADGPKTTAYIKSMSEELYGRKGSLAFGTSVTNNTDAVEAMRISDNGNVGIGTESPDRKLEVDFTDSVYGAKFTRSDATGSSLIEFANSAGVKSIIGYDAGVDGYKIGTASATNLVVKQSGNVGINTTSPDATLEVVGGFSQSFTPSSIDTSIRMGLNLTDGLQFANRRFTSISGTIASGVWIPIVTVADSGTFRCTLVTAAHSNVTFIASRGYNGSNRSHIQVLDWTYNPNGGYANVSGLRIRVDGQVEMQMTYTSGPLVAVDVVVNGDGAAIVASLAETTNVGGSVLDTVLYQNEGMMRSFGTMQINNTPALASAATRFLVPDTTSTATNMVKSRTAAQVLSDIGAAPATGGGYLPLSGGTMTGTSGVEFPDSFKLKWKSVAHSTEVFSITSIGDTNTIVSGDGTNSVKTKIFVGDGGLDINSNDPTGSIADFDYGGISLKQSNVEQFKTTSSGISVKGGDKAQPGYSFIGDTDTGMYSDTANQLEFVTDGDIAMVIDSSSRLLINATSTAFSDNLYINADAYATGGWRVGTAATYVGKLINDGGKLTLMSDGSRDIQIGNNGDPSMLYIDTSTKNIGIGATNPLRKLDLIVDATTDAVRIKNTNSNGGGLSVFAANGGGGTNRILTLGDSAENVKVSVIENGNVGIGTTSPDYKLEVVGNMFSSGNFGNKNSGETIGVQFEPGSTSATTMAVYSDELKIYYKGPNTTRFEFEEDGTARKPGGGSWSSTSDERVKKDITSYTKGLTEILAIDPVNYKYNGKAGLPEEKQQVGVIAQDIQEAFPDAVETYKALFNNDDTEETELLAFNPSELTFTLINAVKELKAEIEQLKQQINN